jgi:alpha/beta hydrolase family protein
LSGEFRPIFADHRGQGGSDKPRQTSAYALPTRVGDAVAVLDALGIERSHFLGSSWGARLGFALGEHAPERVLSLVLGGNQPCLGPRVADRARAAVAASRQEGMKGFMETFESALGYRFPEPDRTWTLEKNDPAALEAAWRSAQVEGAVSQDLRKWRVPCLIRVGEADEMHHHAEQAAEEIPGARFVSLAGHSQSPPSTRQTTCCSRTSSSSSVQRRQRSDARGLRQSADETDEPARTRLAASLRETDVWDSLTPGHQATCSPTTSRRLVPSLEPAHLCAVPTCGALAASRDALARHRSREGKRRSRDQDVVCALRSSDHRHEGPLCEVLLVAVSSAPRSQGAWRAMLCCSS